MAKNTSERSKPQGRGKKGLLQRLQAGLYKLPAHVTSEDDWQKDAPNIKLSRAFAIVLGILFIVLPGAPFVILWGIAVLHAVLAVNSAKQDARARDVADAMRGRRP